MSFLSSPTSNCFTRKKNVGKPDCEINPKAARGGFLTPWDLVLPSSVNTVAGLQAWLKTSAIATAYADRIHHIGPFESSEDKSKAPQVQTLASQREIRIDRGRKITEYTFLDGAFEYYLMVLGLDGITREMRWIPYDEDNNLLAVFAGVDAENQDTYTGQELDTFEVYEWKEATFSTVVEYRIKIAPKMGRQLNEDARLLKTELDIRRTMNTYQVKEADIKDRTPSTASAGVFTIELTHASINLVKMFGNTIANTTVVKARLTNTGAALTLTSVAPNTAGTHAIVTFNTGGTGYDDGEPAQIYLNDVAAIAASGPKYYENSVPLDIILS